MPELKDLNFTVGTSGNDSLDDVVESFFKWTPNGNLVVEIRRLIELTGNNIENVSFSDERDALNSKGELKDGYVREEIEFEILLDDNDKSVTKQTAYFYYKYTISEEEILPPYLPIELSISRQDTSFCDDPSLLETRTFYVKTSELTEAQINNVQNGGFVFGADLYVDAFRQGQLLRDFKDLWDGKLTNGDTAYYTFFPNATSYEDKKYYRIGERDTTNSTGYFNFGKISYYVASDTEQTCTKKPTVYLLDVLISPDLGDGKDNFNAICNGLEGLRQPLQVYVDEDPTTSSFNLAGKRFYDIQGNPLSQSSFQVTNRSGKTVRALYVKQSFPREIPYFVLSFNSDGSVSAGGNAVRTCNRASETLSDCDLLKDNIAPDNPDTTIFCNGRTYAWNGNVWYGIKPNIGTPEGQI